MQRLVESRHAIVGAIDREAVLDQIVGADAEEVGVRGEQVGGQRADGTSIITPIGTGGTVDPAGPQRLGGA